MKLTNKIFFGVALMFSGLFDSCSSPHQKASHEDHANAHSDMIRISDRDRLLANIKIEKAVVKNISEITTLVGKAAVDERKVEVLTSRVKGRVDNLLAKNPGEYIKKGRLIYSIYSEELLADENDYLLALDQLDSAVTQKEIAEELLAAARKKLMLWTLSENQIKELAQTRKTTPLINFYSPYSGFLLELSVREGEYVERGSPLLKLSGLGTLWLETQVYSDEVKYLKQNPSLQIEFEALPDEIFTGQIVFDNPTIESNQKINLLRVQVQNDRHRVKPGMMAYIYLKRNEKKTLVIPKSALLIESSTSVWIEDDDGMYQPRMVTTGIENKKEVEILSGLQAGEKVVIFGAFFLKSESVIQRGGGNMSGMKM